MTGKVYPVDGLTDDIVEKYIHEKKPFSLKKYIIDNLFDYKLNTYLSLIFKRNRFQHLNTPVNFVIHELIENAYKANLKRVFFKLNGYKIFDIENYDERVAKFTNFLKHGYDELNSHAEDMGLYVKVIFKEYADNNFKLFVVNNSLLNDIETKRIKEKINSFEHQYEEPQKSLKIIDEAEGAGMGLFLSLKLLNKAGISPQCISIGIYEEKTIAMLSFSYEEANPPPYNIITSEILKVIDTLPKYPENINHILEKLKNPEITISEIANHITKDPALSADLLKLVNSAEFTLVRKIASIREAINFVGLNGLKNLLYSYGAIKTINNSFGNVPEVWEHSHKTGLYSSKIAKIYKLAKNTDEFFTAGLLHDIGKIVLMNFDKEKAKHIEKVCMEKGVDMPVMEDIIFGLTHARIGGKIVQYWEYPESLVQAIMYHHEPVSAASHFELVYAVYLANIISLADKNNITIYDIEPVVAKEFSLETTDDLIILIEKLETV